MRLSTGLALFFGISTLSAGASWADATSKAVEVCSKSALQQAMLVRSVAATYDWWDRAGSLIGTKVDLDVNNLGKKTKVSCYYTASSRTAVIKPYEAGNPSEERLHRIAIRTCEKAAQRQNLMLDSLVSEKNIKDRKGYVTGREVVLAVFQKGKPAQLVCSYDYAEGTTDLEIRKPLK